MFKHVPVVDEPHQMDPDGRHLLFQFPNGYGASVVRFRTLGIGIGSYTNGDEWELAVLEVDGDLSSDGDYRLTYDTPITEDVLGHLTISDVDKTLDRIAALPTRK